MRNYPGLVSESCHESTFKLIRHDNFMMFYFQSEQLGHSTNTIILKSNEHKSYAKSYAWVFGAICTFQSSPILDSLLMHFRTLTLTTADRCLPSWNRITDRTHASLFVKSGRWTPFNPCYLFCIRFSWNVRLTYYIHSVLVQGFMSGLACCVN